MDAPSLPFESTISAVAAGTSTPGVILGTHSKGQMLNFEVDNSAGSQTITDCIIQLMDHKNGEWYNYKGGTDWDSVSDSRMLFNSTLGVQEVTAGNRAHAHVLIDSCYAFRFVMKAASASPVTVRGTVRSA